jgi:hypothetical protein
MPKPTTAKHLVGFIQESLMGGAHVLKFHQGQLSCDCPGWRFHGRKCKHLDLFREHHSDDQAKLFSIAGKAVHLFGNGGYSYQSEILDKPVLIKMYSEYFQTDELDVKA